MGFNSAFKELIRVFLEHCNITYDYDDGDDDDSNDTSLEIHLPYIRLTCDGLEIHVRFKINTSRKEIYK